jgi:hypothetical protein
VCFFNECGVIVIASEAKQSREAFHLPLWTPAAAEAALP